MNIRSTLLAAACLLGGTAVALADDWPQFQGPDRTNCSREKGLLKAWPKGGPKLLWQYKDAGLGFSGPAVVGDVLYTMGTRKVDGAEDEYAFALDVANDGKQLWATKLGPNFTFPKNDWGDGPRSTPTVDGDRVYCLGGQGELVCLKRDSGAVVWRKNLVQDFGGQVMVYAVAVTGPRGYGYCESPLVDDGLLVCCPGGPAGWMLALDKLTGTVKWRTLGMKDDATYSSIVIATFGGVKQYVNTTFKGKDGGGGAAGIDAADGKVLWHAQNEKYSEAYGLCALPLIKDDLVYLTAGYKIGCNLFKITRDAAGTFTAKEQYAATKKKLMVNDHGGVLLLDGHVYGYSDLRGWLCQDLQSGAEKWNERTLLEGKGSLTYADGRLYLFSDQGEACLIEASSEKWVEKGRFTLPQLSQMKSRPSQRGAGVWTHPVVANGRLYLRDQEFIYCYQVK